MVIRHTLARVLMAEEVRMPETNEQIERRPLDGQVVAVTRMRDQAEGVAATLTSLGAEVIEAPTILLAPLEDYAAVDEALANVARYAWLVITSVNGVDAMFERLRAMGRDCRTLTGVKVAAVGPATARCLEQNGIRPDLVPSEAVGDALAEALVGQGVSGTRVLLLRAETARKSLVATLTAAGAQCDDLPVYRTVRPAELPAAFLDRLDKGEVDWITLTSPSSFHNLLAMLGTQRSEMLYNVRLASIGPVTTEAIRGRGYVETVEADPHDVTGLVAAIRGYSVKG